MPVEGGVDHQPMAAVGPADSVTDEAEPSFDNFDVVDERTSLLRAEGGLVNRNGFNPVDVSGRSDEIAPRVGVPSSSGDGVSTGRQEQMPANIYASNLSIGSSMTSDEEWVDAGEERALTNNSPSGSPPLRPSLSQHLSEIGGAASTKGQSTLAGSTSAAGTTRPSDSDLYRWMQRQQDFTATRLLSQQRKMVSAGFGMLRGRPPSVGHDSCTLTGLSEVSQDDSDTDQRRIATALTHPTFQLADAQVRVICMRTNYAE